jgi:hypothetical protein
MMADVTPNALLESNLHLTHIPLSMALKMV